MLRYTEAKVVFAEVPDEVTLALTISNCPCHCEGCHSPWLSDDIGTELTVDVLRRLIDSNEGITCVCLMGGDGDPEAVNDLMRHIKEIRNIKTAWYSGRQRLDRSISLRYFDYVKLGPYVRELGPLDSKNTNQRFYKVINNSLLLDITNRFQK